MRRLVVFTEEMSAKVMLESLLPRLLPQEIHIQCVDFEGKRDLEKQLPIKLKGWRTPDTAFVILRGQDSSNCHDGKRNLRKICDAANKPDVLIRIACRELESWYIGDLAAVEAGLEIDGLSASQERAKYRIPDNVISPSKELKKITKNRYQKVGGSRVIGKHLSLDNTRSVSFRNFVNGVRRITAQPDG
ncbi:MAG: DUF4276 family protein [Candidatus Hydrogenedentes bacterium]|nr:DUF4276 family protein [Candidatus Hydrogenedentota bacterium]